MTPIYIQYINILSAKLADFEILAFRAIAKTRDRRSSIHNKAINHPIIITRETTVAIPAYIMSILHHCLFFIPYNRNGGSISHYTARVLNLALCFWFVFEKFLALYFSIHDKFKWQSGVWKLISVGDNNYFCLLLFMFDD